MTWNWQLVVTLLLIGAAVVYLTRHLHRSVTSEAGTGCGTGCGGCTIGRDRQCNATPVLPAMPTRTPE